MLATSIQERLFVIATDVDMVFIDFGKITQKPLQRARLSEMRKLFDEGQFPPGTMGPKILAAIRFLEGGGSEVVICSIDKIVQALEGGAGTHIYRDDTKA
jgi:carbamate kinase